jgi:TolB-like protein
MAISIPVYTGEGPYIFVSYAHGDAAQVYPELQWLSKQGVNIWYDEGISPGREWREELGRAIRECSMLVFFVSATAVESPHCRREVNDALDLGINCLTVYLEDTVLPDGMRLSLSGLQAILKYDQIRESFRAKLLAGVTEKAPVFSPSSDPNPNPNPNPNPGASQKVIWGFTVVALVLLVVFIASQFRAVERMANVSPTGVNRAAGSVDVSRPVPGFSNRAAIAVMPFINLSEDNSQEYFADAITEDLITGLQSFQSFPVIARTSTFQYKNSDADAPTIATELGAGYVIEGSVRKVSEQVRINVQLANHLGKHIWADKFDFDYRDVLAIQDALTVQVLKAIEPRLIVSEADRARRVRTEDMEAWDYYIQAVPNTLAPWAFTNLNGQPISLAQEELAKSLLLKALKLDPQFPAAYRLLNHIESWSSARMFRSGEFEAGSAALVRAIEYGKQARQLSPFEPTVCSCLAADLFIVGETGSALRLQEEALRQNPSNAIVHGILAKFLQVTGDYERALEEINIAKRLGPRSMSMSYFLTWEASIYQSLGQFDKAVELTEDALLLSPLNYDAQLTKIISLLAMGDGPRAVKSLQDLSDSTPGKFFPIAIFPAEFPKSAAALIALTDGGDLGSMSYQEGIYAIFAQLGWSAMRDNQATQFMPEDLPGVLPN